MADLLRTLREAGAHEQAAALLARDPAAHASLGDPYRVADRLGELREAGAGQQAAALAERLSAVGMFGLFLEQEGLADQFRFGQEPDGTPAAPWNWEDLDLRACPSAAEEQERQVRRRQDVRKGIASRTRRITALRAARPAGMPSRKTRPLNSPVTGG